jgi:hypothetical protein
LNDFKNKIRRTREKYYYMWSHLILTLTFKEI